MTKLFAALLSCSIAGNLCAVNSSRVYPQSTLDSVFNAFIAKYAKENLTWKKNIECTSSPRDIPAGKQLGISTKAGPYFFEPKQWDDFSPAERESVFHDARFTSFVISCTAPSEFPPDGVFNSAARKTAGFSETMPAFPLTGNVDDKNAREIILPNAQAKQPTAPVAVFPTESLRLPPAAAETTPKSIPVANLQPTKPAVEKHPIVTKSVEPTILEQSKADFTPEEERPFEDPDSKPSKP